MQLTESQRLQLKAFIQADPTLGPLASSGDYDTLAKDLNAAASPAYYGVRTDAAITDIRNAIQWPKYTPAPAITSQNAAQATACACYCQGKQFNLQLLGIQMTSAGGIFDASKSTQTNGLKDATTSLPSGASFANQDAGWTGSASCVANVLVRQMTVAEKVFATASTVPALNDGVTSRGGWNSTTGAGNPDMFGPQGTIAPTDLGGILA